MDGKGATFSGDIKITTIIERSIVTDEVKLSFVKRFKKFMKRHVLSFFKNVMNKIISFFEFDPEGAFGSNAEWDFETSLRMTEQSGFSFISGVDLSGLGAMAEHAAELFLGAAAA